jgi:hypothetical protein
MTDPVETIKALAEQHNLDPMDINAEVHLDRPLIAEEDLSVTVQGLLKSKQFDLAATAIETAVRRAYALEGAK